MNNFKLTDDTKLIKNLQDRIIFLEQTVSDLSKRISILENKNYTKFYAEPNFPMNTNFDFKTVFGKKN